jgi:two-component system, OmpR family, sensor histidine kinase CssS
MKTLNQALLKPILAILIITPILIMIVFNISLRFYINRQTQSDLNLLLQNIQSQTQLIYQNPSNQPTAFAQLRSTLRLTTLTSNTDIIVFNPRNEIIYPSTNQSTILNQGLIDKIAKSVNVDEFQRIRHQGNRYIVTETIIEGRLVNYRVVLVSLVDSAEGLIRALNIILLLILMFSLIIASLIIIRLTKKITAPINETIQAIDVIQQGHYQNTIAPSSTIEINQLITKFNAMGHKLYEANQAQKLFFQYASHELRTPLMSIQGFAEGLKQSIFTNSNEIGSKIVIESNKLKEIIDQLLLLSRLDETEYKGNGVIINLDDFLQEIIDDFDSLSSLNETVITFESSNIEEIETHPHLLSMIMRNILSNALRYAKTSVEIHASIENSKLILEVDDDGDGISLNDRPFIFNRFYKGKNGNTGLGLSIVHRCVELLHGEIHVDNKIGASFRIIIPLNQSK